MGGLNRVSVGLLCFMAALATAYNPWDFSGRHTGLLRQPRTPSPEMQPVDYPYWSETNSWAFVDNSQPRALSTWTPVSVQCGEAQVGVAVKRDLFGTGRLIQAADLSLGSSGCKHTSLDSAEDTVVFEVGLHECGSTVQMTPDSLIYSISLYYKPNPGSNPVIIRTSPVEVPIECHYPRKDNVSSKAIKPTWVPFSSTLSAEERLVFSLRIMNDDWSAERTSKRYQLGEAINIQADVNTVNHVALRLFVDNCVATLSPDRDSAPRYSIIDFHGCLVDGRSEGASSTFLSPRTRPDSLQFTVDAFRFAQDQKDLVYITCHLKVIAGDQIPDALNKACSFNKARSSWSVLEGPDGICRCCETGNCAVNPVPQSPGGNSWWRSGRLQRDLSFRREESSKGETEADVLVGPFILDERKTSTALEDGRKLGTGSPDAPEKSVLIMIGLTVTTGVLALALVVLAFFLPCRKRRCSKV
ncbi:zona pellucida sperm-binding protein 3-like [Sphaerodactylus townsendi]|uniref:zona pellucida sperm-binding protein 3-like n=1 Tax=Sphaerodactylus townsendi TaxID=933632 RepID=UPI00202736F9|nr:zona pellucida sperm-binding protein 3-like [Sphaerodactylus townsendi]